MNKLRLKSLGLVFIVLLATGGLASANLINNGGFEDGLNFWTQSPAPSDSNYGLDGNAHSGMNAAYFAATGSDLDAISQSFATTAGVFYNLSFWLTNDFGSDNEFRVTFGGIIVQDLIDAGSFGYTQYSFSTLATGSSLSLEFAGRNFLGVFNFDDVSVEARVASGVPEGGSSALLLGAALMGLILLQRRFAASVI